MPPSEKLSGTRILNFPDDLRHGGAVTRVSCKETLAGNQHQFCWPLHELAPMLVWYGMEPFSILIQRSQISWAYYMNGVMTNEIVRLVIIT